MRLDTSEGRGLILGGCEQENKPNTVNLYMVTNENGSLRIGGAWTSGESCLRPLRDIIGPSSCLEMSSVCDLNNSAIEWRINATGNNELSPLLDERMCVTAANCACEVGDSDGRKFCLVECIPGSKDQSFTVVPVNEQNFEEDKFVLLVLRCDPNLCIKAHPVEFTDVVLAECDGSDPEQVFFFSEIRDENDIIVGLQWFSGANPDLCIEPVVNGLEEKLRLYHCSAIRDKQKWYFSEQNGGNIHIKRDRCVTYDSCYSSPVAGNILETGPCRESGEFDLVKLDTYQA